MAINTKEFVRAIDTNLKANNDFTRFLIRYKIDGKAKRKILDFNEKSWDKRTRISKAKIYAAEFKESKINPQSELDENIKLNTFINMHFKQLPNTTWTTTKMKHYSNYIKKCLGDKKVVDIRQMHIKECIKSQEELELAPRTIKTTLEILNPVFKEAIANRLILLNPCEGVKIKLPKTKKTVLNASKELAEIMATIIKEFENDPFYLSFYLFAIQGRRKGEIINLRWENIDFVNDKYLIEDTKNNEHQTYHLPSVIKPKLEKFKKESGWVFESSINRGNKIVNVEKQTNRIKKHIPNFTLHRLRNVIVSAMSQQGLSATLLSGVLGHNNTTTLSKYLTLSYEEGSKAANEIIENIANQGKKND